MPEVPSSIEDWAVRLAEVSAPDEVDLAPAVAGAFVRGGSARKQLYDRRGGPLGAFSAEHVIAIMPYVFSGIAGVAGTVTAILTSPHLESILGIIHHSLGIQAARKEAATGGAAAAAGIGAFLFKHHQAHSHKQLPDLPEVEPVKTIAERISAEMVAHGIKQEKADAIAFRVLLTLLESPASAKEFVAKVSA